MKQTSNAFQRLHQRPALVISVLAFCILLSNALCAQNSAADDEKLLEQYVQAQKDVIVFDASNIKQFWISNSVIKRDAAFDVMLQKKGNSFFESIPLKIQLINVSQMQDCKVEIISEKKDINFSILNNKQKTLSSSSSRDSSSFIQYTVSSASFHLEDTQSLTFYLKLRSSGLQTLSIKKIILSFSKNKESSFLSSPGALKITQENVEGNSFTTKPVSNHSFTATGVKYNIFSKKKIIVSDTPVSSSVTIKNVGTSQTKIYVGYVPYTKDGNNIQTRNCLYKNNNKIARIVSANAKSQSITIDSVLEDWEKGCYLALNAKEDLSDFPNFSIVGPKITDIKKIDETHSEIFFEKPLSESIAKGTPVRVQSPPGRAYLFTNTQVLQPGEEVTFSSTMNKDEDFYQFSSKTFCRGTYYVIPVVYSGSVEPNTENTILISDFSVSY